EMSVAGTELEQVGIGIGIADDKVGVAGVDKTDVEFKQAASAGAGAILDGSAGARGDGVSGDFKAGDQGRLVDDKVGRLAEGRRSQGGEQERTGEKRLIH